MQNNIWLGYGGNNPSQISQRKQKNYFMIYKPEEAEKPEEEEFFYKKIPKDTLVEVSFQINHLLFITRCN